MMYPTQLNKLLLQCPSVINLKDTKGEQPIHKAVQQGNIGNVQVLLDHHSEVDPASDAGMTPLMLACYYGYLNIMHLLIEKGANLAAVDSEGCGMVHYAVDGGQVTSIQYLTEVCGVSTHTRDHRLQTSLFKACSQGNIEMLNYLLRKDRSEVAAEDIMGNTALHMAAEKEHSWTCWRLLEVGGLELLHKTNKDSLTPLDVAIQNAPFKNSPAVKMLQYYTSLGSHTGPVTGPRVTWYAHLLLPFAGYLAIFMVIPFTNYRGVVAVGLLFGLLKTIQCHNPRIKSYCRWPNPVYAGMFAAGIFNSLFCMYHEILYYIYMKYQLFTIMCMCQHVALLTVYFKLLLTDPEACTSSSVDEDTGRAHSILDVAEGKVSTSDYCQQCEIVKPRYAHHCRLCNCCFHEMDHHCLLLNKCVGRGTQRLFVLFLLICAVNMVTFVMLSTWYLYTEFSIFIVDARDIVVAIFNYYVFVWTMLLGNAVSLGWCMGMLMTQMWMISNGYLIATMSNVHTKLTYRQCINNLIAFALGNRVERNAYEAWPGKPYGIAPV